MAMHLLIIGGTSFLGRHTAQLALQGGWTVTTFNRGRFAPDVEGVEALVGDRTSAADLRQLADRGFDVVVDTCGFVPRVVGMSVAALAGAGAHYVFVSSMSATTTWPERPTPDYAPAQDCPSDAGPDDGDYGRLKAGCERAVTEGFEDSCTVVRAGLILGPYENVGRLPWWLQRIAAGGEVLAPGSPDVAMQLVDARDIADFMLRCGQAGTPGTFNVTGPRGNATMGSWLGSCVALTGSDATLTWVRDDVLLAHDVHAWGELPLWHPPDQGGDHVWDASTDRAVLAGLTTRPVHETVADTWAWLRDAGPGALAPPPREGMPRNGIDPEKERSILAAWHQRA